MKHLTNNIITNNKPMNNMSASFWRRSLTVSFAGLIILTSQALAGEKPSAWEKTVRSAGKNAPIFWLDGNHTTNKGSELNGEVNYVQGQKVWDQPQTGFWGEQSGAFRIVDTVDAGRPAARLTDSKHTNIGCSENGSLGILFKTASEFTIAADFPPDKHSLFTRGDIQSPAPFEVAVVNGILRVTTQGEIDKPLFTNLAKVDPATWYWVAMSWMKKDGVTHVQWQVKDLANNAMLQTGGFETQALGEEDSFLQLGLTQSKHSIADTTFSQIIVWDTPLAEEQWAKIEKLLEQ